MIGRTLDHFRIESKLGEGGMGVVYKARDTHLGRAVAIKVLPRNKVADPARKQRFILEAKAASALNHPNIVTIHDIRSEAGVDFIVMEFIEGKTLEELIPPGGMHPAEVLKRAVQIADALAKAHSAGIIHRDLKPSNLMVTEEGRIKILDFGLAKLIEPVADSPGATTRMAESLTEEGVVLGTVAYMSPEQAEGRKLDARSDIFSFGSVLYELVTGRRPFTGNSPVSILAKILNDEPAPPTQLAASISPELEKIILRCMQKDPVRRYQTMADLKVALENIEEDARSHKVAWPSRLHSIGAALLLVVLAAGFFVWRSWRAPQPGDPVRAVSLTTFPGIERYPSLSPDGNYVTFMWTGPKQDNADIYVQMINAGSPLRLTFDPRGDTSPVWSPDGRWIAFLRGATPTFFMQGKIEVRLIAPLGGPERKVAEIQNIEPHPSQPVHVAWCPDATCLIVSDSQGERKPNALFVISLDTGERRRLTNPEPLVLFDTNPTVSPDGRSLVFQRFPTGKGSELYLLPLGKDLTAEGEAKRLTSSSLNAIHPSWMPDGKEILFSANGSLWRLAVSGESPPARLPFVGEDGLWPVVSRRQPGRRSRLVYVRSFEDRNIWRVETSALGVPTTSPPTLAISSTREDSMAALSPDGHRVAFTSDRSGELEVWLADLDGSGAVQLTSMGGRDTGSPRWSPDGQTITFDSDPEGQKEIYVASSVGGKPRRLTAHPAMDIIPNFSPDGNWIYFTSNRTGDAQIWKIPVSGGEPTQVTDNVGFVAFPSPDGAYMYYTQTSGPAASPLWRISTSGGEPVKLLEGVVMRAFAVLEKGIYYVDQPPGESRLQFFDFATHRSTTVSHDLGNVRTGLTASTDGRTILYTRLDSSVDNLMLVENFQ